MGTEDVENMFFGRSISDIADSGGLIADLKRTLSFPRTMSRDTVLWGGLLVLASILSLSLPLLGGYMLAMGRAVAADDPAPDFGEWRRFYLRGLGLIILVAVACFVSFFALVVYAVVTPGDEFSDIAGLLWLSLWLYATPWLVGVYSQGSLWSFLDRTAWRWLVSPNYLLTAVAATAIAVVGYLAVSISVLTVVGWLFVAFLVLAALGALLGQRYHGYRTRLDDAATASNRSTGAVLGSLLGTVRLATQSRPSASDTTETTSQPDPTTTDTDEREQSYSRFRERARHVETDGQIQRLEAGDGGRIQFISLEADDEAAIDAFERAVDRWRSISHSDTVTTVYDTGDEPTLWVAYDPLEQSLAELGGDLSPAGVVAVADAVGDAITTGRRYNIAHGAVTPTCVSVSRADGSEPAAERIDATLGDWEIRRELAAVLDDVTLPARYAAPEQFGDGPTDDRADVYQLAATTHYALFGEAPFADTDSEALQQPDRNVSWTVPTGYHVTDETIAVFKRALSTDSADRYESTGAFQRALRRAIPTDP